MLGLFLRSFARVLVDFVQVLRFFNRHIGILRILDGRGPCVENNARGLFCNIIGTEPRTCKSDYKTQGF